MQSQQQKNWSKKSILGNPDFKGMSSSIVINLLLTLSFQSSAASVGRVRERTKEQWDMVVLRRITDMEHNLQINEKYKSAHKTGEVLKFK